MGNVRPERVKRIARELIRRYPDKFTKNFEENKKILSELAIFSSVRLRNSVAGYITRLMTIAQGQGKSPPAVSTK